MGRWRRCRAVNGIVSSLPINLLTADTLSTGKSDSINTPRWSFSQDESRPVGQQLQCVVEFDVPYDLSEFDAISLFCADLQLPLYSSTINSPTSTSSP